MIPWFILNDIDVCEFLEHFVCSHGGECFAPPLPLQEGVPQVRLAVRVPQAVTTLTVYRWMPIRKASIVLPENNTGEGDIC